MTGLRVVDASPLIVLAKIGRHRLLSAGVDDLLVPEAVVIEVEAGPEGDPARTLLAGGFGTRLAPVAVPSSVLEWCLRAGESAVIAEALRLSEEAVLDDAAARRCARSHGIRVVGTLGIVARSRRVGELAAAAPIFAAVRDAGLHFSDDLARNVLWALGEAWKGEPK